MPQNMELFRDALSKFFGLEGDTVDEVIRQVKNSGQLSDIRNVNVRRHAGVRAVRLFHNALDASTVEEPEVDHEPEQDDEPMPDGRLGADKGIGQEFNQDRPSLREYLVLSELQMDIGAEEDPQEVLKRVRLAQRNPVRAANAERESAMQRQKEVSIDDDNPEQSQDMRSAQVSAKNATLQARDVRRKQGRQGQMQSGGPGGTAGGVGESVWQTLAQEIIQEKNYSCQEVWVHETTGEIYEGDDLLSEGFRRQFKRFGNEFRRRFRCMAGPKAGKLVANAGDCGKRPDPKKVRKGRSVMRAKKGTIVRKSKIAKRTAPSKLVSKVNKRLMGIKV